MEDSTITEPEEGNQMSRPTIDGDRVSKTTLTKYIQDLYRDLEALQTYDRLEGSAVNMAIEALELASELTETGYRTAAAGEVNRAIDLMNRYPA